MDDVSKVPNGLERNIDDLNFWEQSFKAQQVLHDLDGKIEVLAAKAVHKASYHSFFEQLDNEPQLVLKPFFSRAELPAQLGQRKRRGAGQGCLPR